MPASLRALAPGLVAAALLFGSHAAMAADLTVFHHDCESNALMKNLKMNIDGKFRGYDGGLRLRSIDNPTTTYERKRDEYHNVARMFCHATVTLNDGVRRDMWYLIETPWGFAGTPDFSAVEFCISGLDPWHVYGKDCSTIRNSLGW